MFLQLHSSQGCALRVPAPLMGCPKRGGNGGRPVLSSCRVPARRVALLHPHEPSLALRAEEVSQAPVPARGVAHPGQPGPLAVPGQSRNTLGPGNSVSRV